MKKMILSLVFVFAACYSQAQLANTSWKGSINAGGMEFDVTFNYKTDTVTVINNADQSVLDVSAFSTQDSVVTITKISGLSSCGDKPGKYVFTIKDKQLTFKKLEDSCYDRYGALDGANFTKQDN